MDKLNAASKDHATSTIKTAMQAFAAAVIGSRVALRLRPSDKLELEQIVAGEGAEYLSRRIYLSFCSEVQPTSGYFGDTTLTFEYGSFGPRPDHRDGAVFYRLDRSCGLNWSSHGTQSPAQAKVRAQLYLDLADLLAMIEAETPESVEWLHQTAEEVKEAADKAKAERAVRAQYKVILDAANVVRSGMRVGSKRDVPNTLLKDVPEGSHRLDIDGKHFVLNVNKHRASVLRRSVLAGPSPRRRP